VVPRFLEERTPGGDDDELLDAMPTVVVCSGELIEQVRKHCLVYFCHI